MCLGGGVESEVGEELAGLGGQRVSCGVVVGADSDCHLLEGTQGLEDAFDAHATGGLHGSGDSQGGEHDGQVRFDGVLGVVEHGSGCQVRSVPRTCTIAMMMRKLERLADLGQIHASRTSGRYIATGQRRRRLAPG